MAGEIFAGLSAVKTAFDLARGLKEIDDAAKRNAAIIDLQQTILEAQSAQQEILGASDKLRDRVQELENWESERQQHVRFQPAPGIFTYAHKEESLGEEGSFPQLCPSCFHNRYKSFLTPETWTPGRCEMLVCRDCGWHAYIQGVAQPEHQKLTPKPYRGS